MSKAAFDRAALTLARQRKVSLHYYDAPGSLSEAERARLVRDSKGVYYNGIALRD
jgi:hypothetical protein